MCSKDALKEQAYYKQTTSESKSDELKMKGDGRNLNDQRDNIENGRDAHKLSCLLIYI